jgi:hypothetical protein
MQYLARWAIPLPANFKAPLKNGKRYTCITFCDGFICFLEKALPELVKHNIPATIFVPSGYLGTCPGWADDNDHPGLVDQIIMDAEQLKSLPTDLVIRTYQVYVDAKQVKNFFDQSKTWSVSYNGRLSFFSFLTGDTIKRHWNWPEKLDMIASFARFHARPFGTQTSFLAER